ncbi:beta-lactamase class A [Herbihabitans rhizosphaerae]|uniref:Beta-lactamase n=1 Tax=Herbihabitans rhizosphaerae TaxID=1872711 RepID=A0A4Q7KMF8_9PSEU|nr:class A beta-lactamase [Herbihabitans rhizosphaerae]RZS36382.1 beta-lactamase class A [Herbihabitans rhizosphaerae]
MASVSRRAFLRTSLAAGVAGPALLGGCTAEAAQPPADLGQRFAALEQQYGARLGVYAINTRTGVTVTHRADERFPMCSTFKTLAAAAILRDRDQHGEFLAKVIPYARADLVANSPVTEKHVGAGMRVDQLCAAAIQYSDNTAANLMLREIGGPAGVTAFCRSIGDPATRLDRWETALNSALPGDPRDTTTPAAIGRDYDQLVLGRALSREDAALLTGWLCGNTTSSKRFRAGLPVGWRLGDKTGGGDYGTNNDVGVTWTTRGTPLVLVALSTRHTQDAAPQDALLADTARLLAGTLAPGE